MPVIAGIDALVQLSIDQLEVAGHAEPYQQTGTGSTRILEASTAVCVVHGALSGLPVAKLQQAAGIATIGGRVLRVVSLCPLTGPAAQFADAAGAATLTVSTNGSVVDRSDRWEIEPVDGSEADGGVVSDEQPAVSESPSDGDRGDGSEETADGTTLSPDAAERWRRILGIPPRNFYVEDLSLYHHVSARCSSCRSTDRTLGWSEGEVFCECGARKDDIEFCEECDLLLGPGDKRVRVLNYDGYRDRCPACAADLERCDRCGAGVSGSAELRTVGSDPEQQLCAGSHESFDEVFYWGCFHNTPEGAAVRRADKRDRKQAARDEEADYRLDEALRQRPRGYHG